jgi:Fe-S cluster assembly protein SufD
MSGAAGLADRGPFAALLDAAGPRGGQAPWLRGMREAARARFDALGVPQPGAEDWRQTDVRPLASIPFERAARSSSLPAGLEFLPLADALPCRAVFVNGRLAPALSTLDRLPDGVRVASLAEALDRPPAPLASTFGAVAAFDGRPFVALNTALFEDGALVTVRPCVTASAPVHVIHVGAPGGTPAAIHPRTLVLAGAGSAATVVETFLSADGVSLTNAVTEIVLDDDARIDHVKIQAESTDAWHVGSIAGRLARDARLASHSISIGARLARNDIGAVLTGPGASCLLHGLYLADGRQHVDNHTWLDHAAPNCASFEVYKGVLAGSARAVFSGRIIVREGAQKTDAKQSNKNLILSDRATVYTRPQLEIFANDVKCTHGATIGRLDETALFYLRSRGIGAAAARDLLIRAFAGEILEALPVPELRRILEAGILRRLERAVPA